MIGTFPSSTLNKVFVGVIALLAIALAIQTWRLGNAQIEAEEQRDKAAKCEARHEVTRNSVSRLEAVIAELNEQAEQRAEAFAEAQEIAQEREKELAKARRSSNEVIARLRTLADRGGKCAVPSELRDLAKGL